MFLLQSRFDELWNQYETYESGEKLFGLKVTDYPILHQRKKEFNLLSKLYSLYMLVNKKVDGYLELAWHTLEITEINEELAEFQLRCMKLPKDMQTWPAYIDLKKKIDDFNEMCPVLELMKSKAVKQRHWTQVETMLEYNFDNGNVKTTLGHVTHAPLLRYKDDLMVCAFFHVFKSNSSICFPINDRTFAWAPRKKPTSKSNSIKSLSIGLKSTSNWRDSKPVANCY